MAANLYQNTMAYNEQEGMPWHQMGISLPDKFTAEEAIIAAKLDYTVKKEQLFRIIEDGTIEGTEAYATVNSHTNKQLGIVGTQYTPIQNVSCFSFFDEFVGKNEAIYQTAGALGEGEKVWLLAKLPSGFEVIAGDRVDCYCLLYNTHNGTLPLSVMFTPVRVVCQNTLSMALHDCTQIVKVRHTINGEDRLAEAGRILKLMTQYFNEVGEKSHELARFVIDDDFIKDYQDALFGKEEDLPEKGPGRSIRLNKIEMYNGRLRNGKGVDLPGVQGTAWWLYNAATEMADWDMPKKREGGELFENVLFGPSAKFKQEAWDTIFELVAVRSK